ncbi:LexA family transcriptional regulator [Methylobacterium sp. BTF04]|uniref:LexA family protein n=1 Tax=Methylobacterium sp. BTF04 TaxID=2708300 RepID=UPI0013D803DC|nr:helix-turn-helix domain-containing protein [Methylobacterium sp. BTF04]NEU14631.1 LexA family transcriptional regulator [Methylobacterium sp. BTF04]
MAEISRTIREIRKRLAENQATFAKRMGVTQSTVSKWESGTQSPDTQSLLNLSEISGIEIGDLLEDDDHDFRRSDFGITVTISGSVQAGEWVEAVEWDSFQHFQVQIPTPKEWPDLDIQGFLVRGNSMNNIYPDGSVVFAVPVIKNRIRPGPGDRVIVERRDNRQLFEVTLKELGLDSEGELVLWPRSNDPRHQTPVRVGSKQPDDIEEVRITGVVVASFVLDRAARYLK